MKDIIKKIISTILYHFGFVPLVMHLYSFKKKKKLFVVFTYHRVVDKKDIDKFYLSYDKGISSEIHRLQIDMINKYFRTLSIKEFIDIIIGQKELNENAALITYDDGDSDFIKHALPALKSNDCPATMFVPSDFMTSDKKFWHLEISNMFHNLSTDNWNVIKEKSQYLPDELKKLFEVSELLSDDDRRTLCNQTVRTLNKLEQPEIDKIVEELITLSGVEYTLPIKCMNWDELRFIEQHQIDVESHAKTHRKLAQLPVEEISDEVVKSKETIEKEMGKKVLTICCPAGSNNDQVADIIEKAGYAAAFTTEPGVIEYPLSGKELFQLKRHYLYGDSEYETAMCLAKIIINAMKN